MSITFAQLKPGDSVRICGFTKMNSAIRQQLMAMGLTRGVEFQVIRYAPLGDPVEVLVRGFRLSLRKQELQELQLERCP